MIEIQNLTKRLTTQSGTVVALEDISLTIRDGDIFGIIGMSGAGKSTLVRCINMLERPDEGLVAVNGRLQSKVYYPGDADGDAPGYGIWNLHTRHTFDGFRHFILEPGIGIDNLFNKKDNRPLNHNFTLYSPGRYIVVSMVIKLKG